MCGRTPNEKNDPGHWVQFKKNFSLHIRDHS